MKRLILWIKSKFQKNVVSIETPKIQILSTGSEAVTEDEKEKYIKDLKSCIENRVSEYPSWEKIVEALVESESGNKAPLLAIVRSRKLIKQKYPKPEIRG